MATLVGYTKVQSQGEYAIFCECVFRNNFGYAERSEVEIRFFIEENGEVIGSTKTFEEAIQFIKDYPNNRLY